MAIKWPTGINEIIAVVYKNDLYPTTQKKNRTFTFKSSPSIPTQCIDKRYILTAQRNLCRLYQYFIVAHMRVQREEYTKGAEQRGEEGSTSSPPCSWFLYFLCRSADAAALGAGAARCQGPLVCSSSLLSPPLTAPLVSRTRLSARASLPRHLASLSHVRAKVTPMSLMEKWQLQQPQSPVDLISYFYVLCCSHMWLY